MFSDVEKGRQGDENRTRGSAPVGAHVRSGGQRGGDRASITQSKAILLDGLFNLIYFLVALVTVRISALTNQPDDRKFPFGYGYFESLVNAGKGLLILGVALFALVDALIALLGGGREILAGPAIVYAVFATLACSFTAWTLRRSLGHLDTPLVRADYENWLINALISSSVLLTFCFLPVARWLGWYQILPYVDSVLVIAVVLFCLSMPIRMARGALRELLNRAPPGTCAGRCAPPSTPPWRTCRCARWRCAWCVPVGSST